jgi:hypothetical protein
MAAVPAVGRECRERRHRRRAPLSHLRLVSIVAVATAAAVASTGCGKQDQDQEKVVPIMSCNLEAIAECDEIIGGMSIMNLSQAEFYCTYRGGSYSLTTRCPTTPVVGTCTEAYALCCYGAEKKVERYYPPTDPATAKASCEEGMGVWASN